MPRRRSRLPVAALAGLLALVGLLTAPVAPGAPAYAEDPPPTVTREPAPGSQVGLGGGLLDGLRALADAQSGGSDLLRLARSTVDGDRTGEDGRVVVPTLTLADVFTAYPRLTDGQREIADGLLARPTDRRRDPYGDGYRRPAAEPECGPRVCVHYVAPRTGDPDAPRDRAWVRRVLRVMESVWTHHVDEMGFRAPAPDAGEGGDDRFDVYLADIGAQGYYGYCTPEDSRPGQERRASGYCVLDNDFAEFDGPPHRNLEVTAAHEFFHAIQFDYDVGEDRWLMESTAVWMEEQYAPDADDNRQYLPFGQLGRPGVPLDAFEPTGLAHYGNWLFFERLTQRYGADTVRRIWDRLAAGSGDPDQYSTQAISRFLRAHGSSMRAFLAAFAGGNLTPGRAYPDGTAYDAAPLARSQRLRGGQGGRFRTRLPHLSTRTVELRPGGRAPREARGTGRVRGDRGDRRREARPDTLPRVLRVAIDGPGRPVRTAARVLVHLADGRVQARPVRLGRDGRGAVQVPFGPARVERVTVTLVNASARYHCWEGQAYACAGTPRDDGQVLSARFRAVR